MDTALGQSIPDEQLSSEALRATLPPRVMIPKHWAPTHEEDAELSPDTTGDTVTVDMNLNNMDKHATFRATGQHQHTESEDRPNPRHCHQQQQQQPRPFMGHSHTSVTPEATMCMLGSFVTGNPPRHVVSESWRPSSANANGPYLPLSPTSSGDFTAESGHGAGHRSAALEDVYAYCFDRGNGNYTRLIPADMLPPLLGIPALEQASVGLVVLPLPGAEPPQGPSSNVQPIVLKTPPPSPGPVSDAIQKTIDNIVARSPGPPKRTKIYCDKWVHEGVCAFTQQGCKYKHEMPVDKATQHSLGLFHGFPTWWKKHQAEVQRQQMSGGMLGVNVPLVASSVLIGAPVGANDRGVSTSELRPQQLAAWRQQDAVSPTPMALMDTTSAASSGAHMYNAGFPARHGPEHIASLRQNSPPKSPCVWGPISPPSRVPGSGQIPTSYGPFASRGAGLMGRGPGSYATLSSLDGNTSFGDRGRSSEGEWQRSGQDQRYYDQQLAGFEGLRVVDEK